MHGSYLEFRTEIDKASRDERFELEALENKVDSFGRTMLHCACHGSRDGFVDVVRTIFEVFLTTNVDLRDNFGKTMLSVTGQRVRSALLIVEKAGNLGSVLITVCRTGFFVVDRAARSKHRISRGSVC